MFDEMHVLKRVTISRIIITKISLDKHSINENTWGWMWADKWDVASRPANEQQSMAGKQIVMTDDQSGCTVFAISISFILFFFSLFYGQNLAIFSSNLFVCKLERVCLTKVAGSC